MEKRKLGNVKQVISCYEVEIKDGTAFGKKFILVNNGALEVAFNADNALDIAWVKYYGQNISFLSKNGFNSNVGPFREKFEGGFIYTCGLDNVSACEKDKAIHGSLHYRKAENVCYTTDDQKVTLSGTIFNTALFGENIVLRRTYTVTDSQIVVEDKITNEGFVPASYVLLYHVNYGYPFLDEGLELAFDQKETIPANEKTKGTIAECTTITPPQDVGSEDLYYHILHKGEVDLNNNQLGISCKMQFDLEKLPYLVEWRNLFSGDYVLGIEPSTTRFDEYKKVPLAPEQTDVTGITFTFKKF